MTATFVNKSRRLGTWWNRHGTMTRDVFIASETNCNLRIGLGLCEERVSALHDLRKPYPTKRIPRLIPYPYRESLTGILPLLYGSMDRERRHAHSASLSIPIIPIIPQPQGQIPLMMMTSFTNRRHSPPARLSMSNTHQTAWTSSPPPAQGSSRPSSPQPFIKGPGSPAAAPAVKSPPEANQTLRAGPPACPEGTWE